MRLKEELDRAGVPVPDNDYAHLSARAALESAAAKRRDAEREREEGQELWEVLRAHPPGRRLTIAQSSRRFATAGVLAALLTEYRERLWRQPLEGLALAQLGFALVRRLDSRRYGSVRVADLEAESLGVAGNAFRMLGCSQEAASLLAAAEERLLDGSGDPMVKAQVRSFQGALWLEARRFERAEREFRRAENLYRQISDVQLAARTLVQRADAVGHLVPERGIRLARRAIQEIDASAHPDLALSAHHTLAWFLELSGRPAEAREQMRASNPLFAICLGDAVPSLLRHWLAGRIERAHHELDAARRSYEIAWRGFEELGMTGHLVLVAIDRAELYALQGDAGAATVLLGAVLDGPANTLRGTTAALAVLRQALMRGSVRRQAFRQAFVAVWRQGVAGVEAP